MGGSAPPGGGTDPATRVCTQAHTHTPTCSSAFSTPTYTHEHDAAISTHTDTRELSPLLLGIDGGGPGQPPEEPHFRCWPLNAAGAVSSQNPGWGSAGRAPALQRACWAVTGNPGAYSFQLWLPRMAGGKPCGGRTALSAEKRPGSPGSWPSSGSPGLCCV